MHYLLENKHHVEYLCNIFSLHPLVSQSTRTPIDVRIESAFGGVNFELCDNLRRKINTKLLERQRQFQTDTITCTITTAASTSVATDDITTPDNSASTITTFYTDDNDSINSVIMPEPEGEEIIEDVVNNED